MPRAAPRRLVAAAPPVARRSRPPGRRSRPSRPARFRRGRSRRARLRASRDDPPTGSSSLFASLAVLAPCAAGLGPRRVRDVATRAAGEIYSVAPPFDAAPTGSSTFSWSSPRARSAASVAVTAGTRPFVAAAVTAGRHRVGRRAPAVAEHDHDRCARCCSPRCGRSSSVARRDRRGLVPGLQRSLIVSLGAPWSRGGCRGTPSAAALDWENWDLFGGSARGTTVGLVWDSELRRHRLSGAQDHRAEDQGAPTCVVLAGDDARHLLRRDRWVETLYATERRRLQPQRCPPIRSSRLPAPQRPLGRAGGGRSRARRQPRHRRGQPMDIAADAGAGISISSGGVMSPGRARARCVATPSGATCPGPTPASSSRSPADVSRRARPLPRRRSHASVPAFGVPGAGRRRRRRSSPTTSTSRSGPTSRCGRRPGD